MTFVLLHGGFGFDSRAWHPQFEDSTDEFTVVAWDAPGCGSSEDPPVSFRMADYADCLAEFLKVLGLRRPHVIGVSFGGATESDVLESARAGTVTPSAGGGPSAPAGEPQRCHRAGARGSGW